MSYLLDTDIIIFWLKGNQTVARRATEVGRNHVSTSTVSQAELYFGAYNSGQVKQNLAALQRLAQTITLRPFDEAAAQYFGQIKANLTQQGQILLDADMMIAAIALANKLVLVTNNTKHYVRISGLTLENWANP